MLQAFSSVCSMRPVWYALSGRLQVRAKQSLSPAAWAWEVLAARADRTRLEVEAERGLTPFVGRERELRLLYECFAQAQAGQGVAGGGAGREERSPPGYNPPPAGHTRALSHRGRSRSTAATRFSSSATPDPQDHFR